MLVLISCNSLLIELDGSHTHIITNTLLPILPHGVVSSKPCQLLKGRNCSKTEHGRCKEVATPWVSRTRVVVRCIRFRDLIDTFYWRNLRYGLPKVDRLLHGRMGVSALSILTTFKTLAPFPEGCFEFITTVTIFSKRQDLTPATAPLGT